MNPEKKIKCIYVVIGTRAQLVKMAPLMALLQKEKIDYDFIYTSQHKETIQKLIDDFRLKQPDKILYSKSEASTGRKFLLWGASMIIKGLFPKKVFPKKGIVLTHGDTATTAWAAIVGKLAGCKVAHIESGQRSFKIFDPFPEEIIRLITFYFSDYYFCPNEWAINNLKKYKGEKINLGANTIYDAVKMALGMNININIPTEKYVVVSIHRFENIFSSRLEKIIIPLLERVANCGFILIFVLHPSTRNVLMKNNKKLYNRLNENNRIILKERYPYFEFLKLMNDSEFVITDGGSNQEELSYIGKPTLLFRKVTERIEGLNENVVISNFSQKIVDHFVQDYKSKERKFLSVKNSPSKIIVEFLKTQI